MAANTRKRKGRYNTPGEMQDYSGETTVSFQQGDNTLSAIRSHNAALEEAMNFDNASTPRAGQGSAVSGSPGDSQHSNKRGY